MKVTIFACIFGIFLFPLQAYLILESKTTVSPGYEGGVISHICTSYINDIDEENDPIFDEDLNMTNAQSTENF